MDDIKKAAELLAANDEFHILIHAYPDGDTIGSGFALCSALRSLGKKANVVCKHEIPSSYSYITKHYIPQEFEPKTFVAVDVAALHLLGEGGEDYSGKILLCIDHHGSNQQYAEYSLVDPSAAANCEIILRVIKELGVEIDKYIAECIYTGISTDTGCFKYSNTTPETHRIAADMMEFGIDEAEINRVMFDTKSRNRFEIERLIIDTMEFCYDGRVAIIAITNDMKQKTGACDGDLEGITSLPRQVEGVIVGVTLREKSDNIYKISIRTHAPVDAAKLCEKFGGGGHMRAAGCAIVGTLDEVKSRIKEAIREFLD